MSENKITVTDNIVVSLEYVLQIDEGQEIDRSDQNAPLEFLQGHKQIIPGLEKELYGMGVGDEKEVKVSPEEGYGIYNPKDIVEVDRKKIPTSLDLAEGKTLGVRDSQSGESYTAYVKKINPDSVLLDFNHPLAGKTLHFHVKIAGLRDATSEELAHGHVHGEDHEH